MSRLSGLRDWVDERLPTLLADHQVPAAAVAICAGDEVVDAAAGVLSRSTRVEATPDSLFQIGSITKPWTATLAMQLVDEGRLDLDVPVRAYLRDFSVADPDASSEITVRQLMCHTAGFEGDIFTDTGPGDDCLQKYVAALAEAGQLFAPGRLFSYNNAAYCVLGRVVEVLRNKTYDECLRDHLITPLRLTHAATGPHEAILYRTAVGHIQPTPGSEPQPVRVWALPRSVAPVGAMLSVRPRDLVAFLRMHLRGGTGPDGATVLSESSVRAMQTPQVAQPDVGAGSAWGLGWEIFDWDGTTVIGHDGSSMGNWGFARVVPDRDVAVAVLTNGGDPTPLYTEIVGRALRELAGVEMPPLPVPPADPRPVDASRYVGEYASVSEAVVVSQDADGRVWATHTPKGHFAERADARVARFELVQLRGDTLIPVEAVRGRYWPHAFLGADADGRALFLHTGHVDRRLCRVPG